jgi:ornithine cyclodeaminase
METAVITLRQIEAVLPDIDLLAAMERAFVSYSAGLAIVPPVGELLFEEPPGDAHIKYGYVLGDEHFVVKVATGFYENSRKGLPPNAGLMLVFSATTGIPAAVLLDEGHLTNVRTAAAGAVAARHLAPPKVQCIGICGTGMQARMQLEQLKVVTPCRDVAVWGRSAERAAAYAKTMARSGFDVEVMQAPADVAARCNLIVTATISETPLLSAKDVRPGTHITAMGSDTPAKNELASDLLLKANLVAADSISQCSERGEIHHAVHSGILEAASIVELGKIISGEVPGRTAESDITVADLTGVAVQDIEISKAVLERIGDSARKDGGYAI